MRITKIISSSVLNGLRVIKHTIYKGVVNTNELLSSFGLDANPYPGIKGAHESATTPGRGGILSFFCKFLHALYGERRMFSTLPDGSQEVTEIFQLNDGSILIRAGMVGGSEKYSMLIDPTGTVMETALLRMLTGNMKIEGDLEVIGDLSVDGDITATGDIEAGGISLKTHTHGYLNGVTPSVTDPPN